MEMKLKVRRHQKIGFLRNFVPSVRLSELSGVITAELVISAF
jgi:hypothetical protein